MASVEPFRLRTRAARVTTSLLNNEFYVSIVKQKSRS